MRRALVVCTAVLGVLLLGSAASADVFAVAKPETQTVAINGAAAQFDGSDSYAEDPPCPVTDWAWDFDGDGEDDHTENWNDRWGGAGFTTYVYEKAGIFTCRLTVTDEIERQDTDTQEVKVRLEVSSGEINGTSVELLWDNANDASQFICDPTVVGRGRRHRRASLREHWSGLSAHHCTAGESPNNKKPVSP